MPKYKRAMNKSLWMTTIFGIVLGVLSACGGGGGVSATQTSTTTNTIDNSSPSLGKYAANQAVYSETPFSAQELAVINADALADADVLAIDKSITSAQRGASTTLIPCKLRGFVGAGKCYLPTAGYYSVDSISLGIGPEVAGCQKITVGSVTTGITAPAGGYTCYQFITGTSATLNTQIALPSGINAIGEIYAIAKNLAGMKVADDLSNSNPLNITTSNQNIRVVLMVRPENGAGGQPFSIGVGVPAAIPTPTITPTPTPLNTTPEWATQVAMNKTVSGSAGSTDGDQYFFYQLLPGQTGIEINAKFTSNQTAGYCLARKTSSNSYVLDPEIEITHDQSEITFSRSELTSTPNIKLDPSPLGIMVRVGKTTQSTTLSDSFSLRIGVLSGTVTHTTWNNENLNVYDAVLRHAFSYLGINAKIVDENGTPIEGEVVYFEVLTDNSSTNSMVRFETKSDQFGVASYTPTFAECAGRNTYENITYSSPGDHWLMNGQPGRVRVRLPNSIPQGINATNNVSIRDFLKICHETYRGRY